MNTGYIDLHLHTNHSDGSDPPEMVVARALEAGLAGMAVTDHDTVSGVAAARDAANGAGIGFLTGVEISAAFDMREIHVLGLGIDIENGDLLEALNRLLEARDQRAEQILDRLNQAGIPVDEERVHELAAGGSIGRMHIARMLKDNGVTRSPQDSFNRFLNFGGPAYVRKELLPVDEAIAVIQQAGGLAFLAHPGLGRGTHRALPRLMQLPFDGIEAWHTSHSPGRVQQYLDLAGERQLLITGGSDCHGTIKRSPEMGKVKVPAEYMNRIQEALAGKII